jgi:hypothetical protein
MRLLRGLGGALLWIVASLLGLVAVLLCVTLILLPVGLPLLNLARQMFGTSVRLMLPRKIAHPVKESRKAARRKGKETGKGARKKGIAARKQVGGAAKKRRKLFG